MRGSTAGRGDPYWYEWTVGLLYVVELLDPDTEIESVAFQTVGVKGWDDVVVRRKDGAQHLIQVKHSRIDEALTFGDLVAIDKSGESLLGTLAKAWVELGAKPAGSLCILYTNRNAGERAARSESNTVRPPLLPFYDWLKRELAQGKSVPQCQPPPEWGEAWQEWTRALGTVSPGDQTAFLQAFELKTDQDGLEALLEQVRDRLAALFQVPVPQVAGCLQALDHALRQWTTGNDKVTVEDVCDALALDSGEELDRHSPPPPAPFFPTRIADVQALEKTLVGGSTVIFMSAPPGAGKTSVISELANRRTPTPLAGTIGLRYFAFRPLSPEAPLVPPDSDQRVRADRLWYDLLSQLRRGLHGRLAHYGVPVRNELLTWEQARNQVLRIADQLGREGGRPFIIAIDGIDHAARAARHDSEAAREFFVSLPDPQALKTLCVRLLIAGQSAEHYPEYPAWLATPHPDVAAFSIGRLGEADVATLLRAAPPPFLAAQEGAAINAILDVTSGNTLSVVFAAAEARSCRSVEELVSRLRERRLGVNLDEYYRSIWEYAGQRYAGESGVEISLAGTLCMARERLTGSLMASAFPGLAKTADQWEAILAGIGPLVVSEAAGFRVLHNDVRIFLQSRLSRQPEGERRRVASGLASHYLKPESNRKVAHEMLLRLLRDSDCESEWARIWTCDWVFEAAALDLKFEAASDEAIAAVRQAAAQRDWNSLHEVACAMQCLERWQDWFESGQPHEAPAALSIAPVFLQTEARVQPRSEWNIGTLRALVADAAQLVEANEIPRAEALLRRWLAGLSLTELADAFAEDEPGALGRQQRSEAERLGGLCLAAGILLPAGSPKTEPQNQFIASFENGWVASCSANHATADLAAFFRGTKLRYISSWEHAGYRLAAAHAWAPLTELLEELEASYEKLSQAFQCQAACWAARLGLTDGPWLSLLGDKRPLGVDTDMSLRGAIALARGLGWRDATSELSTLTQNVFDRLGPAAQSRSAPFARTLLYAAASLGRIESAIQRRGVEVACDLVPANQIGQAIRALWSQKLWNAADFRYRVEAGDLGAEFVRIIFPLGGAHTEALFVAAAEPAGAYVMDDRKEALWDLYQRAGRIGDLRAWLNHWLGDGGLLWQDADSQSAEILHDLAPLGTRVGEEALIDRAAQRLHWMRIRYRVHKDDSFVAASRWFDQLAAVAPEEWRELGVQLWSMSDAASNAGCDNELSSDIDETLGACAFKCGTDDVRRLIHAIQPNERPLSWFHSTRHRLLNGFRAWLKEGHSTTEEKLSAWCLLLGYNRWFDHQDVADLALAREAILTVAEPERTQLEAALTRISPSEARRQPTKSKEERTRSKSEKVPLNADEIRAALARGEDLQPTQAAFLLDVIRTKKSGESTVAVLRAVGTGLDYSTSWEWTLSGVWEALAHIGSTSNEDEMWALAEAAARSAGRGSHWSQGVAHNLQLVILARARTREIGDLRSGLARILRMHELWLRGGQRLLPLRSVVLPPAAPSLPWSQFVANELVYLLQGRSAEVLSAALTALLALVEHDSTVFDSSFQPADLDPWTLKWLLLVAESLAATNPDSLDPVDERLQKLLSNAELQLRAQAWVVQARRRQLRGLGPPPFSADPPAPAQPEIIRPQREFLHTLPRRFGGMQLVDRELSAASILGRTERATGANLGTVKTLVADQFSRTLPADHNHRLGPVELHCDGDMFCGSVDAEDAIARPLLEFIADNPLPPALVSRFMQGYLPGEDPCLLRTTPKFDPDYEAWPADRDLGEMGSNRPDPGNLRRRMLDFSLTHAVPQDAAVLAARLDLYSWRDDFTLTVWWKEGSPERISMTGRLVNTMSGRTFPWHFGTWWEPESTKGRRSLVFGVGSLQRLNNASIVLYPARLWVTELGWAVDPVDPLVWRREGKKVAWYERWHGPLRSIQGNGQQRQPLLSRWLVTKEEWQRVQVRLGPLSLDDSFAQDSMPERD